jgi:hypothetical protein
MEMIHGIVMWHNKRCMPGVGFDRLQEMCLLSIVMGSCGSGALIGLCQDQHIWASQKGALEKRLRYKHYLAVSHCQAERSINHG